MTIMVVGRGLSAIQAMARQEFGECTGVNWQENDGRRGGVEIETQHGRQNDRGGNWQTEKRRHEADALLTGSHLAMAIG